MNKSEYLAELKKYLAPLSKEEIEDILRDQDEYITAAIQHGRSEAEVLASLGDPKIFATNLLVESKLETAQNSTSLKSQLSKTFNAVIAVLALTPLNVIFVLIPLTLIIAITFLGWLIAFALLVGSAGNLAFALFHLMFSGLGIWTLVSYLFYALGFVGVGILAIYIAYLITKYFIRLVLAYLRWNLNFIKTRI